MPSTIPYNPSLVLANIIEPDALESVKPIAEAQAKPNRLHKDLNVQESPVDYIKTKIKMMPLGNDSVNMDVQYFSLDTVAQDSQAFSQQISSFVSASTSWMGVSVSTDLSTAVQQQVQDQTDTHEISGTLVISVNCTHKRAAMLAPCILDVDEGIKVWNHYFPNDEIVTKDLDSMREIASPTKENEHASKFSIISGVTYGSSFVGMVHILNNSQTFSSQQMGSFAASLQSQIDAGGWFAQASGGFGMNASFAENVKSLLSSQNVMSHVSMICMGVIPSIVADEVRIAESDPKATMEAPAGSQNPTTAVQDSLRQSADAASMGQQMITMKSSPVKATPPAPAEADDGSNKILDVNSLMTALEDYFSKVAQADSGVPINYYLKDITKDMLASMWMAKYFPGESGVAITYDDSDSNGDGDGDGDGQG